MKIRKRVKLTKNHRITSAFYCHLFDYHLKVNKVNQYTIIMAIKDSMGKKLYTMVRRRIQAFFKNGKEYFL